MRIRIRFSKPLVNKFHANVEAQASFSTFIVVMIDGEMVTLPVDEDMFWQNPDSYLAALEDDFVAVDDE